MPTLVELPDGTELEFPEGMDQSAMQQAISKSFPQFIKTAAPQVEGPSLGEKIQKSFTTEGLPEPVKRLSSPMGWQQPAIGVAPFWTTPPWVHAAKLLGFPKVAEAGQAMAEETANAISGMTSPLNVGLVVATKAHPLVGLGIAGSMIPQVIEGGKQAYKGMTTGDIPEVVRGGTKAAIGTAGAVLGTVPLAAKLLPRASAELAARRVGPPDLTQVDLEAFTPPSQGLPFSPVATSKLEPTAQGVMVPKARDLTPTEASQVFDLGKLSEESNREIEQAYQSKAPESTPVATVEPQVPVAPEPAPAPETPPAISAPEAKARIVGEIRKNAEGDFEWVENGKVLDTASDPAELIGAFHSDNADYSTRVRQVSPDRYELELSEPKDPENPTHELVPYSAAAKPKPALPPAEPTPPAKVEATAAKEPYVSGVSATDKGISQVEKEFRSTAEGQKAMANRASRIAVLNQMNEAIRKVDPKEAYDRALIEQTPDSQIDSMLESLRQDYNRLVAKLSAKPAAETGKEMGAPDTRTTPAPGTPEREVWNKERSDIIDRAQVAYEKAHDLREQRQKTSMGTKKYETLGKQMDKADDAYSALKGASDKARAEWQQAGLEDVAGENIPIASEYAASELEARKLAESGQENSARKVRNDAWDRMKSQVEKKLKESGLTDEEARDEAMTISSMVSSYPLAESRRLNERFGNIAKRVQSQRGVPELRKEFDAIESPVSGTTRDRFRARMFDRDVTTEQARKVLSEYKDWVAEQQKEAAKREKAKSEKEAADIHAELLQAREWEATGTLHWIAYKDRWAPVEGKSVNLPGVTGINAFIRKTGDHWTVTEERSGLALGTGKLRADAIKTAAERVAKSDRKLIESKISEIEKQLGPRPEIPKAQPKPPETPPTGPGMELGMSIIPPPLKRSLKTFAVQDIAPALRAGVNTGKAAKDAVIHAFSPASAAKPRVVDTMFKSKGYSEQVMTQAASAMEDANKQVRVMPRADQIAFVDRVKRGQAQPTQELTDLADLMRRWDDYLYSEAQVYKPSLNYLDNHLRVLWKVIPGTKARRGTSQQQILSKRPWRGSQGFTKRHVLDDMSEGIALGGEPVTYNPVEMFLLHAQDVMKFVAANRAWQSLKGTGDVTFVKFGRKPPDDFVRINDSIAKAYFTPAGMKGVRAQTGEWWVQKDAARLIENYLSKDRIRNNPVGRALMGLKNATTAIELGLSPFHAVFESLETMGSTFGLGLSKIASGDIVSGLKTVAETPISPKTVSKLGRAGIKYAKNAADFQAAEPEAYNWFVSKFPGAAQLLDDMFAGGGQVGMHQDYKFRAGTGFGQALQEGNYPGAVLRAVPALNQAVMKPLFQIYIPRLKVGTFLREYSFELSRRADDLAAGKITREQIARQTWAFVEDRFGEMNFDNLYWNRTFKSALQLLFRSVTWKLGNLRGFGKAARDATAELGWRWFTEGRAPEMTMPMAWALGMSITTAAVSSLVTKAATGKYPWELAEHAGDLVRNLVFPRISLTDESQRVSTPTYWRDAVHLSHSVPSYISSSMSGEKGRIMDVWNNRDFYGVQVMNPDDPIPKKVAQAMQHLIPVPFGASSWLAAERTGATRGQALAGFFGFTKAPYYISHTPAEQKGLELARASMKQGSRTRDEFERSIRERQAVEAIKRGDMTVQEAFRDGLVTQDRMKQVQRRSTEPLLENLVTRLSADDALRVYKAAEPEEKDRLKFRLQQKILRAKKTPAEKGQLLVELEK